MRLKWMCTCPRLATHVTSITSLSNQQLSGTRPKHLLGSYDMKKEFHSFSKSLLQYANLTYSLSTKWQM